MIPLRNRFKFLPIRVHSWGGLGSQIFACVVARRLLNLFPARKVVIVFHSSGVTRRVVEIPSDFTSNIAILIKDDFYTQNGSDNAFDPESPGRYKPRILLISLLVRFGVLARLNSQHEFLHLRPYLLEVRGHYTQISLSDEEIVWIAKCLQIVMPQHEELQQDSSFLHLRLGDLLTLHSKSHIDLNRLSSAIRRISANRQITVYSDSGPSEVKSLIQDSFIGIESEVRNEDAVNVIRACVSCKTFVGTNSKISLWIAIIRCGLNMGTFTALPKEILCLFKVLMPNLNGKHELIEY